MRIKRLKNGLGGKLFACCAELVLNRIFNRQTKHVCTSGVLDSVLALLHQSFLRFLSLVVLI